VIYIIDIFVPTLCFRTRQQRASWQQQVQLH